MADDSPVISSRLEALIDEIPSIRLLGVSRDVTTTTEAVRRHQPDLLLLDLGMPGGGGMAVLRRLRELRLHTEVIVLTNYACHEFETAARAAGAVAFFNKHGQFMNAVNMLRQKARQP